MIDQPRNPNADEPTEVQEAAEEIAAEVKVEETKESIEEAVVASDIEIPPSTPEKARQMVLRAEHVFDPLDVVPVEITNNRAKPFRFTRNFRYRIIAGNRTMLDIEIDAGFECDLGSFPWFARWIPGFTQAGKHVRALAIHDFLYRTQLLDKITSDFISRQVMLIDGVSGWMRFLIMAAVIVGGRPAWNENKRLLKKSIEKERLRQAAKAK